jgi:transposase
LVDSSIRGMVLRWRRAMNKKYVVRLAGEERDALMALVNTGKTVAYKIKHANILLKADADGPGWTDAEIAEAFGCHARTVENVRRRFVLDGLAAALERKKRAHPPREKVIDGEAEARLIALACGPAPEGRARWTLNLLADKMVELEIVESVSYQTVRRTLKKTGCSLIAAPAG